MMPIVIAHRGARGHAPENTLAAARAGHAQGAHMLELDTCLTKDGHLVVVHDDSLERTTDVAMRPEFAQRAPWQVHDFSLAEIQSLSAGSWFVERDPFGMVAAGEVSDSDLASFASERIPTLRAMLELVRDLDWRVNVEIKDQKHGMRHHRITADVCALITELGMEDRVLISSFQHAYLREAAILLPRVPRGALVEFTRPLNPVDLCRDAAAIWYHPDKGLLDRDDLAFLSRAEIGVNVWTVNEPEDVDRLTEMGVSGIITDFPARVLAHLAARKDGVLES